MATLLVNLLFGVLALYGAAGLIFAVPFLRKGVPAIDPSARGASWGFRLCIAPGVIALWPVLAWRWRAGAVLPERTAHRDTASPGDSA